MLIFVFPPIFVQKGQNAVLDLSKFNFFVLVNLCAAIFLLAQKRWENGLKANEAAETEAVARLKGGDKQKNVARPGRAAALWKAAIFSSRLFTCYGALLLLGILFYSAQRFFGETAAAEAALPHDLLGWLACALSIFVSALFEETLYRWYLPHALETLASQKKGAEQATEARPRKARLIFWGIEAACVVLFALAHRWQGALAVLNALFGGIILRLCAVKSKGLAPGIAAHFLYNASALLFSL